MVYKHSGNNVLVRVPLLLRN